MHLWLDNEIIDFEIGCLRHVLANTDRMLQEIDDAAESNPHGDALGIFDYAEFIAGVGFVSCQKYMKWISGTANMRELLQLGPTHTTGETWANIIYAAANYWKHSDEWDPANLTHQQRQTAAIVQSVSQISEYTCSNLLFELTTPADARFEHVLPSLLAWRNKVAESIRVSR